MWYTCFKQIPHLPLEKSSNSRLLQILNKQIPQVCPGGGCQGFDLIRANLLYETTFVINVKIKSDFITNTVF
jgi:hypothetical protein